MITEEQRLARRNFIGGSDMPIIMGLSTYKTAYQLYLEKKGLLEDKNEETEQMYWGNRLEGVLREEFAKRNKLTVEEPKDTIEHPLYDFLRGNLDGYIPELNAVWEGKTSSQFMAHLWGEDGSDIIPLQYLVQIAFYCAVTNSSAAYLSVLIGGNNYREFLYKRDYDLENKIIDAACEFWDALKNDRPPAAVNQIDLKRMFPKHSADKCKKTTTEIDIDLKSLKSVKEKIKEFEALEEKHKFNLMNYMQDAEHLTDNEEKPLASWKTNKSGSRTFLLKGNKNDK